MLFLWLLPGVTSFGIAFRDRLLYHKQLVSLNSTADHSSTEFFVYLGSDDPFCYDELVYDTWWFTDRQVSDHCFKEMKAQSCYPISSVLETTDFEFLQTANTVKCLGVKGTTTQIKSEQNDWYKVYTLPGYQNLFGEIFFVKYKDLLLFLAPSFKSFLLIFDGETLANHQFNSDHRRFLPHHYFNYMNISKQKLHEILVVNEKVSWQLSPNENISFKCDLILYNHNSTVEILRNHFAFTFYNESDYFENPIQMSCKHDPFCICTTVELSSIILDTVETPYIIDTTSTWYSKIFDFLVSKFFNLLKFLFNGFFGPNWQVSCLVFLMSHLFFQRILHNPYVTLAISFLVMIWLMDF